MSARTRGTAGSVLFKFIEGDARQFAGLRVDGQVIVLSAQQINDLRARYGTFYPLSYTAVIDAQHTRAQVRWARDELVRGTRIRCALDARERPMHCHHEKLVIVDGTVAFVGGAGIADWWAHPTFKRFRWHKPWRDTMARIEGPVVAALQGVAAENWLECCGEIITGPDYFPNLDPAGDTTAFVVKSSPSDRATASRVTFQMLMEAADHAVHITTPYFLPDRALRRALVETARRGVKVTVIVPGRRTDQKWVRLASRRMWGQLLEAGIRIYEYRDTMTHAKVLVADEVWSVLGTTNIDNRSFEHNDEVNLAMRDPALARRLLDDYLRDIAASSEMTLERWQRRPLWEKTVGPFIWILERQQ